MVKLLLGLLVALLVASAQQPVKVVDGTGVEQEIAPVGTTALMFYTGGNLTYMCKAASKSFSTSYTVTAATLTNIVVSTNVGTATTSAAHGLRVGNRVTVTGATVDTDLNGTYLIATVPTTTSFTFTTASVSNATYTDATLALASDAPSTAKGIWAVSYYTYDANGSMTSVTWAEGSRERNQVCDNRATLAYQ